ncbi:NUDIX domain-containing protein [Catellatospora vulcania]|uniref:NUDIX domain-containing protein n=1 Tax=Catellatospora vulcania TaxID=1460450 RepID=UPI001E3E4C7D|nr:NUDIX domain-containing protein [Catellatospora vulcania]
MRAVLLDGDDMILFERTRPGVPQRYWATPGGGVDRGDANLLAALHRELDEELRAVVTPPVPLTFVDTQREDGRWQRQHLFACRLVSMDVAGRHGHEFTDPAKGTYDVVRVPFTAEAVGELNMQPEGVAAYLITAIDQVWEAAQEGRANYSVSFASGTPAGSLRQALHEAYGLDPADIFAGTAEDLMGAADVRATVWINPDAGDPSFGCELSAGDSLARATGVSELELATRLCRLTGTTALVSDTPQHTWLITPDGDYHRTHALRP